ncbi:MAG: DUF2705 family protein [Clostridia bacterium]|nr:DUF2705 family protein [Clostridia bacterium]
MKRDKVFLTFLFALSIFLQIYYFRGSPYYYEYGFSIGYSAEYTRPDAGTELICVLLPLLFIIFLISGSISKLTDGYGKLWIIRNYSKSKLFLKNTYKNILIAAGATGLQVIVYYFFNDLFLPIEQGVGRSVLLYFLILHGIILLQSVLELYMQPHIANIGIFIFSFASYFTAHIMTQHPIVKIILFPCLLFGMENGAIDNKEIYSLYLTAAVLLNITLLIIGLIKFRKTDIF